MISPIRQRLALLMTGNSLRARLIRGGLGSAGIQATNRILALGLGIVLARWLGPDGYGVYAYAFAIMSLLMVLAEAGVPTLLMREMAASHSRTEWGLLRGALRRGTQLVVLAASVVSLIGFVVLWWFADSLRPEVLYTTALMLLLLPVSALCKTVAHAMRGLYRVVVGQAVDMLIRPLLVLIIVAIVFMVWPEQRQPYIAMAAQLTGALVVLLFGALVLRHFLPSESRMVAREYQSRQWLKSALPFTLIGGAGIINSQTDIIMLGWFTGPDQVGSYRVATQGALLLAFGQQALIAAISPHLSEMWVSNRFDTFRHLVRCSALLIGVYVIPLALTCLLFSDFIVETLFGQAYSQAVGPFEILLVGQAATLLLFGMVGPVLSMTGNEVALSKGVWIGAVGNIVLNGALIPLYGTIGAAIATSLSFFFAHLFLYLAVMKHVSIDVSFMSLVSGFLRLGKLK